MKDRLRAWRAMPLLWLAMPAHADITVLPSRPPAAAPEAATVPEAAVPTAQQQCFQVQFLLRLPGLESLHFIGAVKSLQDINRDDQDATNRRISELSAQALTLRRDEARAFARLTPLLKNMGATASLQAWAASEVDRLGNALFYTKDEQKDARTEPQVAAILATLDEADALNADTDTHLASLGLWLDLTRGHTGLWAGDVGEVAAALHVALVNQEEPRLSATLARHLRATAPAGTPPAVTDALGLLIPKVGNLSDLAPAATTVVPLPAVAQAHDALLTIFHAKGIIADNDQPADTGGAVKTNGP